MKTIAIRMIAACLLAACIALSTFGQSSVLPNDQGGNRPENMGRNSVPTSITDSYVKEYPKTTYENWYYYPAYSASDVEWYFYTPSETSVDKEPEFYVVEFTSQELPYKIIYSKEGKRMRTYRTVNSSLPSAVSNALTKGNYKTWTVTKEKEEIIRELDKMRVYKVVVEKGGQKHALYFKENGKLLKDKLLNT